MDRKHGDEKTAVQQVASDSNVDVGESISISAGSSHLKRELSGKQVQLYAIGAAIGTGVFVSMGSYLPTGGPAGLFLGFLVWSFVSYAVSECYGKRALAIVWSLHTDPR